jgi:DedD protein
MSESPDAHLQLKKRARRRLVGAVAFAGLAAVILPMVMDEEPKQQVQDVQIRIPGQDQTPFKPKVTKPTAVVVPEIASTPEKPEVAPTPPATVAATKPAEPPKPADKVPEKPVEKKVEKVADKHVEKTVKEGGSEPQRAAAILGGKVPDTSPASNGGQYVILIGAFSNSANVKQLQTKIGELGVKVFTESLDSPEGKKTRVRAGPFPSREAADKALEKMKRIGVNGVVAAKQ